MRVLFKTIKYIFYYIFGHFSKWLFYSDKYFHSNYFTGGKIRGISAPGWEMAARSGWQRILLHSNIDVPWPCYSWFHINGAENIEFDPEDIKIFQVYGIYMQALKGKIKIGKGTYIGPNVGIITTNHDLFNLDDHVDGKDVVIGSNCWIGMNSMILPGVILGNKTIVGAGSVVTKSFAEGKCVVAGNPAKVIRYIEEDRNND